MTKRYRKTGDRSSTQALTAAFCGREAMPSNPFSLARRGNYGLRRLKNIQPWAWVKKAAFPTTSCKDLKQPDRYIPYSQ
ncbi:MAG: hypothetical protein AAGG44_01295, partial [Planctomycetota bacterium]